MTERLLAALQPRAGQRILELAAGAGGAGLAVAPRLVPDGVLLATDFSPEMIAFAQREARRRGLENVEHRVLDAQRLDLPDASVDGVLCRFGFMLMPESAAALAQAHRVLRAGGRLAAAVWGAADRNPWAVAYGRSLVERGLLEPPQPGEPNMFALADGEQLAALAEQVGFTGVLVEEVAIAWSFGSFEEYARVVTSLGSVIRDALARAGPAEAAAVEEAARRRLEPYASAWGYDVPGSALVVSGTA